MGRAGVDVAKVFHAPTTTFVDRKQLIRAVIEPSVLAHGRALLSSTTPDGMSVCLDASMRTPTRYLTDAQAVLNFNHPVATIFMSMLGNIEDLDEARSIMNQVVAALPSGGTRRWQTSPTPTTGYAPRPSSTGS